MDYQFDWNRILFNGLPTHFLWEVVFRSSIMFLVLLTVLRLTGKRGVKQLSIFETVIIIALGSAAGDPMFYEDVGVVPAIVVLLVVLFFYRLVTWLTGVSHRFERLMEGETECLIVDGKFSRNKFKLKSLSQDEFFTELRLKSIDHLGQVKKAYLETTGDVSVYFFEDNDVRPGLPITPELFALRTKIIKESGLYACSHCGDTKQLSVGEHTCEVCKNKKWALALNNKRIA